MYIGNGSTNICATCSEHFTRRYSATRHNLTIHNGRGEIVRLIEYLVGRSSGRYRASHPFWYKRNRVQSRKFGSLTVADSVGDVFQHRDSLRQAPLGVSQYSTNPILRPTTDIANDQEYGTGLSQETNLKIEELKLANKYPQYCTNIYAIIKLAICYATINGMHEMLEQLL
ncbi:MAG: hypothetical protein WB988_15620 [Candidatus Nitrosopolaris sp.]|jgi:hypothetical protein